MNVKQIPEIVLRPIFELTKSIFSIYTLSNSDYISMGSVEPSAFQSKGSGTYVAF